MEHILKSIFEKVPRSVSIEIEADGGRWRQMAADGG